MRSPALWAVALTALTVFGLVGFSCQTPYEHCIDYLREMSACEEGNNGGSWCRNHIAAIEAGVDVPASQKQCAQGGGWLVKENHYK